jgi:hypothetical protein
MAIKVCQRTRRKRCSSNAAPAFAKSALVELGITPTELGMIGSTLFFSYAIGKLVNGGHPHHQVHPGAEQ